MPRFNVSVNSRDDTGKVTSNMNFDIEAANGLDALTAAAKQYATAMEAQGLAIIPAAAVPAPPAA